VAEGPPQQKALIGPVDTTSFTGGYDSLKFSTNCSDGSFDAGSYYLHH
jgi:hypothetical protein